ncbi:hypothetical protein OJ997_04730 [Solirubrobacter phytolaccae]|uniref:Uncharacterized protein n=1 Tax=Solirubrobacter phytolaccae TaxID=1404360 RepID=A0A9X3N8H5_9ACTN|nr:hypothetical protein [Solirubrobacter phytolaccae]MDA0179591.1 hypothetical protein [Solirubrobacter phytolaccae]
MICSAVVAPTASADDVYFSVGLNPWATIGLTVDDFAKTRIEYTRGGRVLASSVSGSSPYAFYNELRLGALVSGDVLNLYRNGSFSGAFTYTGPPSIGADACAGRTSFTVTGDEGARIEDAGSYFADVPGSRGEARFTNGNPATITLARPLSSGETVYAETVRSSAWNEGSKVFVHSYGVKTIGACAAPEVPAEPQPPVTTPTPTPEASPDSRRPDAGREFQQAIGRTGAQLGAFTPAKLARKGKLTLAVDVPAAGTTKLRLTTKAKGRTVVLGSGTAVSRSGQTTKVTLKLTADARALLKRSKRLKVTLKGTFIGGGRTTTQTTSVTLKR